MAESQALSPSIALAAYTEPLCDGRRVLVFGNALSGFAVQLLGRGARLVHVCDPDLLRVAEASARNTSRQLSFSALVEGNLALRDAAFDLVVVENLGAGDVVTLVRKARRALAPRGVAIFVCPNPEAGMPLLPAPEPGATVLDYYALYDAVSAEFPTVRMLGQTPFVGYAIVDFAPKGEPEPAFDSGFVPGGAEEPDYYIAVASEHAVTLEEFSVVQLPLRQIAETSQSLAETATGEARTRAEERQRKLEAELEEKEREQGGKATEAAAELERQNAWIAALESRATIADERADQAQVELEEARERASGDIAAAKRDALREVDAAKQQAVELSRELSALRSSLMEQQKATALLQIELEEREARISAQQTALKEREVQIAKLLVSEEEPNSDVTALEQQLVDRAAEIRRMQRDLREAERTGKELVRELARARMTAQIANTSQSHQKVDELSAKLAEKEADLTAASWTIDAMLARLERLGVGNGTAADLARSDVQHGAVLLAQLAADRGATKEVR